MKNEEYKNKIMEMLNKLDESDERFLKQLCILLRNHLKRKNGINK